MGGFTLIGPHFIFENLPNKVRCRCLGFTASVDQTIEDLLLHKDQKILDTSALPDSLLQAMEGFHLGDEKHYVVKRRVSQTESKIVTGELSQSKNPAGGTFIDFHDLQPEESEGEENDDYADINVLRKLVKDAKPWYRKG
jgi:hypothetical protein